MTEEYSSILEGLSSLRKLRARILEELNSKLEGIGRTEYVLMHKICRAIEPLNMSELSESTGYSNAIMTLTVDGLETKGLVNRTRGKDRRSYLVTLTRKGVDKCKEINRVEREVMNDIFARMSTEDSSELQDILKRLDDIIVKYI